MDPIWHKLNLGELAQAVVIGAPESFEPAIASLGDVEVLCDLDALDEVEFSLAFVTKREEIDALAPVLASKAPGDPLIWFAYPKGSSKRYTCEFNRDTGWQPLGDAGFEPVRQVSIDEDWSALRFRREEHIKRMTRAKEMAMSEKGKARTTK